MIGTMLIVILIGVLLWAVNTYVPMPGWCKTVVNVIGIVFVAVLCWTILMALVGPVDLRPLPLHR